MEPEVSEGKLVTGKKLVDDLFRYELIKNQYIGPNHYFFNQGAQLHSTKISFGGQ